MVSEHEETGAAQSSAPGLPTIAVSPMPFEQDWIANQPKSSQFMSSATGYGFQGQGHKAAETANAQGRSSNLRSASGMTFSSRTILYSVFGPSHFAQILSSSPDFSSA